MYPTKTLMDYITEVNRMFPNTSESEYMLTPNTSQILQHSIRSSNSTDTSPESLEARDLFMSHVRPNKILPRLSYSEMDYMSPMWDTPSAASFDRPDRPIMGQNIFTLENSKIEDSYFKDDIQQTPPNTKLNQSYYELFPTDTPNESMATLPKLDFNTQMNLKYGQPNTSPRFHQRSNETTPKYNYLLNRSPTYQQISNETSPKWVTSSQYGQMLNETSPMSRFSKDTSPIFDQEMSPRRPVSPISSCSNMTTYSQWMMPLKEPLINPNKIKKTTNKVCTFCRKNGESPQIYLTHSVKEKIGNKSVVTCPILRSHVCSACGVSGDDAHTISYCPILRSSNNGMPLPSTTVKLKSTRIKSNGRRRF